MSALRLSRVATGLVVALLLATGLLAALGSAAARPAVTSVTTQPLPTVSLTIQLQGGLYVFSPHQVAVASQTPVAVRIVNYDPIRGGVLAPSYLAVSGTIGGSELVLMGSTVAIVHQVAAVSQTFTMVTPGLRLNAPIPPALSPLSPTVVIFTVVFPAAGTFVWTTNVLGPGPHGVAGVVVIS